jgi:uncharacterized delta-60 repeat protein
METDLQLSYFVCAISSAGEFRCSIYNSAVVARLQGWHHHWNFTTGHGDSSDCAVIHPCVDFQNPRFFFDPDEDRDGGSHAVAEMDQPITLTIPLDGVSPGQLFVVNVEVTSSSFNRRQGETYIGSFLRDPAKQAGLSFETQGIEPVQTNLPRPPRPVIQPAPACSGASDPAAGTIQFAEANYFKAEVPGQGAYISITRAGGTKGDVSVLLTTADGTAQAGKDYEPVSKVIRFGDGDNILQLIPVKILTDKEPEPDETVQLTLSDPRGCAQLGSQATSALTILDDDGTPPPAPTFAIGGTVTGLVGTGLTVRNTQNQEQVQPANGTYSFPTKLPDTEPYNVIIASQPANPAQFCSAANGSGTIANADVTNINIDCAAPELKGSLDPTFGSNGTATYPLEPAKSLALQSDGKLVIVGGMTLSRFNPDGTADTAFAASGKVTIVANGGPLDAMEGVAVQSDGKIVVAGHTSTPKSIDDDFVVARFNSDGSKDQSFGTGGMTITDFAGLTDQAHALAIQPDGKIVVAGWATRGTVTFADADFAVARYLADGALDGSFGNGGKITTNIAGPADFGNAVALQSDGSIVVVGRVAKDGGSNPDFGIVRYLADGRPDPSFAITSLDFFGVNESDGAEDVVIQSDGKIVAGGFARSAATYRYALARTNPDGTLDKSFGTGGLVNTNFSGQDDFAHALALQVDGKIVVAGQVSSPSRGDFGIARYLQDGTLDAFGAGGIEQIDFFGGFDAAFDVAIQPDGKIVAAGSAVNGTGGGLAIARILP